MALIKVNINILPEKRNLDVELDGSMTAGEVIEKLIDQKIITNTRTGYSFVNKDDLVLKNNLTVEELVKEVSKSLTLVKTERNSKLGLKIPQYKNKIANGKIDEVLSLLLNENLDRDDNDLIILLSSQFKDLKKSFNSGIITNSEFQLTKNKIIKILLDFLN